MKNLTFRASLVVLGLVSAAVACSSTDDGGGNAPATAGNEAGASTGGSSGTGGGDNALCTVKSSCANDPAPDQSAVDTCNTGIADASCGAKFEAFRTCANTNRVCSAAGKTDTLKTAAACKTEAKGYADCKGPVDAGKG
jgi:hypothetical protein